MLLKKSLSSSLNCRAAKAGSLLSNQTQRTRHKPECMYAVDAAWHVLPVIYVCGLRVEDLKHRDNGFIMSQHVCRSESVY